LVTGSEDKLVIIYSIDQSSPLKTFKGHTDAVFAVNFNPQTSLIVSGSFDETVRIWDVKQGTCKVLFAHSEPVSSVCFNKDGSLVVSSGYDGLIRIWDSSTGQCHKTLIDESNSAIAYTSFTPNSKYILTSRLNNTISLWDYSLVRCAKTYQGHENNYCCPALIFMGDKVICGSSDGTIFVWDLQTREILQKFKVHDGLVY
jgi:COMPASS component SWD3